MVKIFFIFIEFENSDNKVVNGNFMRGVCIYAAVAHKSQENFVVPYYWKKEVNI